MKIVRENENILKLENSSKSIYCYLSSNFLVLHFAVFGFSSGIVSVILDQIVLAIIFWLPFAICFVIAFTVMLIKFWMGKYKKQKYCIFNKSSGIFLIKNKGIIFSSIESKKLNNIKQADILKEHKFNGFRYKARLIFKNGEEMYLHTLGDDSLSHNKEIAQTINQFLNITPEPELIVEGKASDPEL